MRRRKRNENEHWTDEEKEEEHKYLKKVRAEQEKVSGISLGIFVLSASCFAIGFIFVILVFLISFHSL